MMFWGGRALVQVHWTAGSGNMSLPNDWGGLCGWTAILCRWVGQDRLWCWWQYSLFKITEQLLPCLLYKGVCVCVLYNSCVCKWRREISIGCFVQSHFSWFLFDSGSFTDSSPSPQHQSFCLLPSCPAFPMSSGVLMVVRQALHCLSCPLYKVP